MSIREAVLHPERVSLGVRGPGKLLRYIPGLLALFAVGYAGKIVAGYVPHTEYVIFAIAIGMLIANTMPIPLVLLPGINTYELWLKTGIVLMGATLVLQNLAKIGAVGLFMVVAEIMVSILVARVLARAFRLSDKLGSLIGVGVGICGVSAIIGAAGAIEAEEEDSGYAIATILTFGAIMVFLYPIIGRWAGFTDQVYGFWAGLSVDNTAETIAAGFAYSEAAGKLATVVKLARNALMGLVILGFALSYARQGLTAEVDNKVHFVWSRFPKFLLGFLAMSLLATLGAFTPGEIKVLGALSKWAFLLTFAGVGFATQFSKMRAGIKPFLVGLGVEGAVSVVTLLMILALTR